MKACSASSDSLVRSPPKGPDPFAVAAMAISGEQADGERDAARAEPERDPHQAGQRQEGQRARDTGARRGGEEDRKRRQREQGECGDQLAEPPGLAPDLQRLAPGQEDRREDHHADEVAEPPGLPGIEELVRADDARDAQ